MRGGPLDGYGPSEGQVPVAEHLAARGADVSPAEGEGIRPLHTTAERGHVAFAEHLAARGAEASPADDLPTLSTYFYILS